MANQCAICGADINLIQTQKLSDGNCICRKNCRKKGFKVYDYVHSNLPGVKAHLAQVERGTKLWDHYFVPRMKTKDMFIICLQLKRLLSPLLRTDRAFLSCYNDSEKIDEADSSDIS